jgi:hypothetical protein
MTNLLIDLVLAFWMLLFGGMALLPIVTGGRGRAAHEPEDRVISIAPARRAPATPAGARMPLARDDQHDHHRSAA